MPTQRDALDLGEHILQYIVLWDDIVGLGCYGILWVIMGYVLLLPGQSVCTAAQTEEQRHMRLCRTHAGCMRYLSIYMYICIFIYVFSQSLSLSRRNSSGDMIFLSSADNVRAT